MERNREFSLGCGGGVGDGLSVLCVDLEDGAEGLAGEEAVSLKDIAELLAEAVRSLVRGILIPPWDKLLFPLAPIFPSL